MTSPRLWQPLTRRKTRAKPGHCRSLGRHQSPCQSRRNREESARPLYASRQKRRWHLR